MTLDARLSRTSGLEMFTGSQLLVKGALESPLGVHLFTGHASPLVAPLFAQLQRISPLLDSRRQSVQPAGNDALALWTAVNAARAGQRVLSAHSTQGLASAADALGELAARPLAVEGAAVVLLLDDPWSIASAPAPVDPRFLAQQARLPFLEPDSPQDLKDCVRLGIELSHALRHPVAIIVSAELLHGGGSVACHPHPPLAVGVGAQHSGPLPASDTTPQAIRERATDQRLAAFRPEARRLGINQLIHRPVKGEVAPLGFIAVGQACSTLTQALASVQLLGRFPMLRLALPFPFDDALLGELAKCSAQIIVIEERRPFIERLAHETMQQLQQHGNIPSRPIWGKQWPRPHAGIPAHAQLHASLLIDRLEPLLRDLPGMPTSLVGAEHSPLAIEAARVRSFLPPAQATIDASASTSGRSAISLPLFAPAPRVATFCPGCPHRDVASVFHELRRDLLDPQYMLERHKRQAVNLHVHADAGCASLMANEPHGLLVHSLSPAGLSAAAAGPVGVDTRHLVLLGDGALFKSGLAAISQSIASLRDVTVVVLDNHIAGSAERLAHAGSPDANTASPKPPAAPSRRRAKNSGTDSTPKPLHAAPQDITRILTAMIPRPLAKDLHVVKIDPSDRTRFRRLVEQSLLSPGLQVVVADKECGLTFHQRQRNTRNQQMQEQGFVARQAFMNVATEVCEYCLECTVTTGCTALSIVPTDHGPKIQTDLTTCVNDAACQRIDACPSFETVIVTRTQPPNRPDWVNDDSMLPMPAATTTIEREHFRVLVAGIGGQGVTMLTDILAHAANHSGLAVQFVKHHGPAIRTGPVAAQMVFSRIADDASDTHSAPPLASPHIPAGTADLLLALDALEGLRAVSPDVQAVPPTSTARTAAVINTSPHPSVGALVGRDAPAAGHEPILQFTHPHRHVALAASEQAQMLLGSAELANTMLLGAAFQSGFLPFDLPTLQQAVRAIAPDRIDLNLRALHVGRRLVHDRQLQAAPLTSLASTETPRVTLHRKVRSLRDRYPGRRGRRLAKHLRIVLRQARRAAMLPDAPGAPRRIIPDDLWCQVVVRTHDCLVWDGRDYASRYCNHVVGLFRKDSPDYNYALTRAALDSLARVMVIKDEVYVAALLTSPEKLEADRRRFNIQPDRGDDIAYVHHNHPEFEVLGKRIRFEWKSRDWQLRLMARLGVLRHVLPGWHAKEHEFRDWFESLLPRIDWTPDQGARAYQKWLTILAMPQQATGYREVRYPKLELVRRRILQLVATDASQFEPAPNTTPEAPVEALV